MTITNSTTRLKNSLNWIADLTDELTTEFSNIVVVSPREPALEEAQTQLVTAISTLFPCSLCLIPAGEAGKDLVSLSQIWEHLENHGSNRRTLVIGLGGGTTLDVAGFAASTYFRGVAFWSVPTTLLAMVDAGIGGKTGINFHGFKNHIGSFAHPGIVWLCPQFLCTLSIEELANGWAECLKHALLEGSDSWNRIQGISILDENNQPCSENLEALWLPWVQRQASFKLSIVEKDFKESGLREILNAGHTVAHALESYSHRIHKLNEHSTPDNTTPIPHGKAVAWGLLIESLIRNNLSPAALENLASDHWIQQLNQTVRSLCSPFPFQSWIASGGANIDDVIQDILALTRVDKKNKSTNTKTVAASIIASPGDCNIQHALSLEDLAQCLKFFLESK